LNPKNGRCKKKASWCCRASKSGRSSLVGDFSISGLVS
jgi:hypothetical protein